METVLNLQNYSQIIKKARIDANISQERAEIRCSVGKRRISLYEHGKSYPRLDQFIRLLNYLGYEIVIKKKDLTVPLSQS